VIMAGDGSTEAAPGVGLRWRAWNQTRHRLEVDYGQRSSERLWALC